MLHVDDGEDLAITHWVVIWSRLPLRRAWL